MFFDMVVVSQFALFRISLIAFTILQYTPQSYLIHECHQAVDNALTFNAKASIRRKYHEDLSRVLKLTKTPSESKVCLSIPSAVGYLYTLLERMLAPQRFLKTRAPYHAYV